MNLQVWHDLFPDFLLSTRNVFLHFFYEELIWFMNADALSTLKKWSISRSLLSMSCAFSFYFQLQIQGYQREILIIWGKDVHAKSFF